ncbi:SH3 domain-containing C40 family peptidase [Helicobacter sp. MIT 14-3879]|uniref:SH3 domain-containing C40 family peptidase n=1 Tax=Helicobacter sp. MIT 14-3879 TaxID=2040649 RepID=UPI000E1E44BD|nr:SH3 domain-containing C40 family peptidase [Helicobacter sp. MIT 14-3879]RDU64748.1 hypothetical protein CQA44_03290 [Helicobacter sp. MIT 14-3879]
MHIISFLMILIFCGCAIKNIDSNNPNIQANLSQSAIMYASENNISFDVGLNLKDEYLRAYFSIWNKDFIPPKSEDVFWGLNVKSGFDESKKKIQGSFFDNIIKNMRLDSYPSMQKKAVMVKTSNVRVLPTIKPRYSTIDDYPFDRWQNSLIFAFTPIIVLHEDLSKEWVLIQSSFVSGWVKSDEIAYISNKDALAMMSAKNFVIPFKDKIPLYSDGLFVQNARIGMIFEKHKDKIIVYKRNLKGNALRVAIKYNKDEFRIFPLPLNEINIANVADILSGQNYGWGGIYENRDCSSFIRDIFSNFAIWLPRNSKAQVNHGKITDYSKYMTLPSSNEEKLAFIKKYAKPFRTIIWLKGHIMLYIGEVNENPIVMHQVWGVSSNDGSEILSRVSITTLTPALNRIDSTIPKAKSLLDRIQAINIIF